MSSLLTDYSKFKANITKPRSPKQSQKNGLEANLGSLASMDAEQQRRQLSGGYDMGFDLELPDNPPRHIISDSAVALEDSMASLEDPFQDDDEEEEILSEDEEQDETDFDNSNPSLGTSRKSTTSKRQKYRRRARPKDGGQLNQSTSSTSSRNLMSRDGSNRHIPQTDLSYQRSGGSMGERSSRSQGSTNSKKKGAGKLGDFLNKDRKKTSLLPGSTTEDLCSEMNEVVSMLGANKKRSGQRGALRSSNNSRSSSGGSTSGPPTRRTQTDQQHMMNHSVPNIGGGGRLRDYSQASSTSRLKDYSLPNNGPRHRMPRRSSSHGSTTSEQIRRAMSNEESGGTQERRKGRLPPKSKSHDGSRRQLTTRRANTDPTNSFVTGSRIRRIQPGGSGGNTLNKGESNLRQTSRNLSPSKKQSTRSKSPRNNATKKLLKPPSQNSDASLPSLR